MYNLKLSSLLAYLDPDEQRMQYLIFAIGISLLLAFLTWLSYRSSKRANRLLRERNEWMEKEKKRLQKDIEAGAEIQLSLLPDLQSIRKQFPQLDIHAHYKPARFVGGDFYDVFVIDKQHLGFLVADVSGKGIPAAAIMLICHTAIKLFAQNSKDPGQILQQVNNHLAQNNPRSMFVSAFLAILNVDSLSLHFANAGHNLPLICDGKQLSELSSDANVVLGIEEDRAFSSSKLQLTPHHKVLFFTDGLIESVNKSNEAFGIQRVREVIKENRNETNSILIEALVQKLDKHTRVLVPFDDTTILLLGFC